MKTVIALCVAASAAFFTPIASAETYMAKSGDDKVIITPSACPAVVTKHLKPEHVKHFRLDHAMLGGKLYIACWAVADMQTIVIVYEDGDTGQIPVGAFELVQTI